MKTDLSAEDYAACLSSLYSPLAHIEERLHNSLIVGGDSLLFFRRSAHLLQDLQELSCRTVPLHADDPPLETLTQLLGAMYVIEGSVLGAKSIANHLKSNIATALPLNFFDVPDPGKRWKEFWCFVERQNPDESLCTEMIDSACRTFSFFLEHLNKCAQMRRG